MHNHSRRTGAEQSAGASHSFAKSPAGPAAPGFLLRCRQRAAFCIPPRAASALKAEETAKRDQSGGNGIFQPNALHVPAAMLAAKKHLPAGNDHGKTRGLFADCRAQHAVGDRPAVYDLGRCGRAWTPRRIRRRSGGASYRPDSYRQSRPRKHPLRTSAYPPRLYKNAACPGGVLFCLRRAGPDFQYRFAQAGAENPAFRRQRQNVPGNCRQGGFAFSERGDAQEETTATKHEE